MRSSRKAQAVTVLAFSFSLPKANFERAVDSTVHREFALLRKDLGDGDVEGPDWVAFTSSLVAPRPSGPAAGRCRVARTHGEARSASGSRWSPGAHKDNHRVATAWALRKATQAASCSADSTSERASCAPIGMSSTNLRLHHLRTIFGFRRYCAASAATQAFDRCIAARTVCLVAALP